LISTFTNLINTYFIELNIFLIFIAIIINLLLYKFNYRVFTLILATFVPILLMLAIFWVKLSFLDMKVYSYIIPLSHLVIVIASGSLLFNSIHRYRKSHSKIEQRFIYFYLINFLVWFIVFFQDIITIGSLELPTITLNISGLLILNLAIAAAIIIYYIGKSIFYPNYRHERVIENLLFILFGLTLGFTISDINNSLYVNSEPFYQQTFVLPNLFQPYGIIAISIIFAPYAIIIRKSRKARTTINESLNRGGRIDPVALPRLKLTELSMYVYLLGAGSGIILSVIPAFLEFDFPFGLNTIISIPFILATNVMLFLAFQTPDWLKTKWREESQKNIVKNH
jgi:hypothetical protein